MTRPRRRRRYEPDWPVRLPRSRRRLGRSMLLLAAGIVVSVIATALLTSDGEQAGGGDAPLAVVGQLEQHRDGWYLRDAQRLPLASVERLIDGDTLEVRVAQTLLRVRVFGIDAPERDDRCADAATERLRALAGTQVQLLADQRQQDGFGRELRYLATPAGRSIDATLMLEGLARAWPDDGALRDALVAMEAEARAARRGCLWGSS